MFNWLRKKDITPAGLLLHTDIHSHLLPQLDDGVSTFEEAEAIVLMFKKLGYQKIITTPHVMSDAYRNTSENILAQCALLNQHLKQKNIDIPVSAAAEYYLDEHLFASVERGDKLLTFGDQYLLLETNFLTEPLNFKSFIFMAQTSGYRVVLAHPERYLYLQSDLKKANDLLDRGVYFQVNISSLTGYYALAAQKTARKLIDARAVHFLGSDCHHLQHIARIEEAQRSSLFNKAVALPLLNTSL